MVDNNIAPPAPKLNSLRTGRLSRIILSLIGTLLALSSALGLLQGLVTKASILSQFLLLYVTFVRAPIAACFAWVGISLPFWAVDVFVLYNFVFGAVNLLYLDRNGKPIASGFPAKSKMGWWGWWLGINCLVYTLLIPYLVYLTTNEEGRREAAALLMLMVRIVFVALLLILINHLFGGLPASSFTGPT